MPYKEFQPKDTLEQALSKLWGDAEDFVPTTRLEEIICKIADAQPAGSGGGGGGSSDFSTATVTIVNISNDASLMFVAVGADYGDGMEEWSTMEVSTADRGADATFLIPVYKEGTITILRGVSFPYTVTATGDIAVDGDSITILGNGTITIDD